MKKPLAKLLGIALSSMIFQTVRSQSNETVLNITGGYTPDGYNAHLSYNKEFGEEGGNYLHGGLNYRYTNNEVANLRVDSKYYFITLGYKRELPEFIERSVTLLGIGATAGGRFTNGGDESLQEGLQLVESRNYHLGGYITGEYQYIITDELKEHYLSSLETYECTNVVQLYGTDRLCCRL